MIMRGKTWVQIALQTAKILHKMLQRDYRRSIFPFNNIFQNIKQFQILKKESNRRAESEMSWMEIELYLLTVIY